MEGEEHVMAFPIRGGHSGTTQSQLTRCASRPACAPLRARARTSLATQNAGAPSPVVLKIGRDVLGVQLEGAVANDQARGVGRRRERRARDVGELDSHLGELESGDGDRDGLGDVGDADRGDVVCERAEADRGAIVEQALPRRDKQARYARVAVAGFAAAGMRCCCGNTCTCATRPRFDRPI